MRGKTIVAVMAALVSVYAAEAPCQIVFNQPGCVAASFYYSGWSLDPENGPGEDLSQTILGFTGFMPIRENFEARYQFSSGFNTLDAGGVETSLSGIGDLRLQLAHSFSKDRLLLSAGLNLPTGKRKLDPDDERQIVEFLSRDYLSVPLRRYGEGFGFNLQAGAASELGPIKLGVSGVYDYCGSYRPYEGIGEYDPGDVVSLNATASMKSGAMEYIGDIGFSYFGTDALDGQDIYRQAPQLGVRLSASLPRDRYSATLGMRAIIRDRNKRYSVTGGAIESQLKKYGDEFDAFLRINRELGGAWTIGGLIGTRQILASEEEFGRSSLFNIAADLSKELSRNLYFDLGVMYHTGSADDGKTDLSGLQISGGLKVSY